MNIICSANLTIRERWQDALQQGGELKLATDLDSLKQLLASGSAAIVLLHLSLPELGGRKGIIGLRRDYPNARLLVFSDQPDEPEGLVLLQEGVYGYCNTYMAQDLLQRAVEVVKEGEVWVGWKLMQRLIKGINDQVSNDFGQQHMGLLDLTEREREIAWHVAEGASNKKIASSLDITERTVKAHLSTIFRKTETRDRLQLALLVKERSAGDNPLPPIKVARH